jgi:hypothetical protein
LINHEFKSKETEAKRGEVAEAKARNGQRDYERFRTNIPHHEH